jgi:hypothetical protein
MERTLLIEEAALGSEGPMELVNWRPDIDLLGGADG